MEVDQLLAKLGATSARDVAIDWVAYPPAKGFRYQAICGRVRCAISEHEAVMLRRAGAQTGAPKLLAIEPRCA